MKIITSLRQLKKPFKDPVIAIGIFDGVHLGHKKVLREVRDRARRIKGTGVVVTFDPHPRGVLGLIGAPPLLVSLKHRLSRIEKEGIDVACVLNFNKTFAGRDPKGFIKDILVDKLGAAHVVIGSGFRFGKDQTGGIALLRSFGGRYAFAVTGVPVIKIRGDPVSSTRIRNSITHGRLEEASRLLGRPVSILGTVIRGRRVGRILGYPTANINPHHEAIPPAGVYAVYAILNGKRYKGILNIGFRPTFKDLSGGVGELSVEVHIMGFKGNIYGRDIEVIFIKKLRGEKRFSAKEKLISQIRIDERCASVVL